MEYTRFFMSRLFVTGDTHGLMDFSKLKRFCVGKELDREDYIIIAGDCGVLWSQELKDEYISEYEALGVTILFVDGNHENYDMLYSYPVSTFLGGRVHKISQNIYHLIRGEIYSICGKTILAFGGGESNDMANRIEHKTWWADESITEQDFNNAKLNLMRVDNCVDYVISHVPPTEILPLIKSDLTCCGEELPWYLVPKLIPKVSNDYVQKMSNLVSYNRWCFGHIHIDITFGNFVGVYDRVLELK